MCQSPTAAFHVPHVLHTICPTCGAKLCLHFELVVHLGVNIHALERASGRAGESAVLLLGRQSDVVHVALDSALPHVPNTLR